MSEQELLQECKGIYRQLEDLYWDKTSCGYVETIRKMFTLVGGKVYCLPSSDYIQYDGSIEWENDNTYTIGGYIYDRYLESNFFRLIEDLTMGYYRVHGGEISYTPNLIKTIKSL